MRRALLVNRVRYGGVALPPTAEAVMTVRRAGGVTDWEASVTLPGRVEVPASGDFSGSTPMGPVAGIAAATAEVAEGDDGPRTTVKWRGVGDVSLPE